MCYNRYMEIEHNIQSELPSKQLVMKQIKLDKVKIDRKWNLRTFILMLAFMLPLICFITISATQDAVKGKWFSFALMIILLICDSYLVLWYGRIYESNKKRYDLRERLINILYSGKYTKELEKVEEVEYQLHNLENELSSKIAKDLEKSDD